MKTLKDRILLHFQPVSSRVQSRRLTRLNTEHLGNLFAPLGDNLKDFAVQVSGTAPKPKNASRWVNASRNRWS